MIHTTDEIRKNARNRLLRARVFTLEKEGKLNRDDFKELDFSNNKKFNESWGRVSDKKRIEIFKQLPDEERDYIFRVSNKVADRLSAKNHEDPLLATRISHSGENTEKNENPNLTVDEGGHDEENPNLLIGEDNNNEENSDLTVNENSNTEDSSNSQGGNGGANGAPARVKKPMPKDPDWGHLDDDKFKITDGDIIDFLMKEVILESTSWALNKAAGLGGIFVYEIGTGLLGGMGKGIKGGWDLAKDVHGNFHADSTKENGNRTYTFEQQQKAVNDLNEKIKRIDEISSNKNAQEFLTLNRMIAKHFLNYDENTGKLLSAGTGKPVTDERFTKEYFDAVQKEADKFRMAEIKKALSEKGINASDKDIEDYFKKQLENEIEGYRKAERDNKKEFTLEAVECPFSLPNGNKFPDEEMLKIFNKAAEKFNRYTLAKPELKKIEYQSQLFAQYYSQFQIDKEYCQDDNRATSKIYRKQRKERHLEKQRAKKALEAKIIFLKIEQARLNGVQGLLTREELLAVAKNQSEDLAKLIKDKKFADGKIYVDRLNDLSRDTKKERPVSLKDAATNTALLDSLSDQINLLQQAIDQYEKQERNLANKRGRAHNVKKTVKEAFNVSPKDPPAKEMSLRTALSENNALMVPTEKINNDDIYLLIACGDIVADENGCPCLKTTDKKQLLVQKATSKKDEDGNYTHSLEAYPKELFTQARITFEDKYVKIMTKLDDQNHSPEEIKEIYRKYMEQKEPINRDNPDPECQLFLAAQERFAMSKANSSSWKKSEILANPINQPPKQQKTQKGNYRD